MKKHARVFAAVMLVVVGVGMTTDEVQQAMHGEGGPKEIPVTEPVPKSKYGLTHTHVKTVRDRWSPTFWGVGYATKDRWTPGKAEPVGWLIAALGAGILVASLLSSKKPSE